MSPYREPASVPKYDVPSPPSFVWRWRGRAAALLSGASLVLSWAAACARPMTVQEKTASAEVAFTTEQLACIDSSDTLERANACRAAVRARWDAGAAEGGAK